MTVMPIAKCMNCGRDINWWELKNIDYEELYGEPQFCCKKCRDRYVEIHGKLPFGWQPYLYT